MQRAMGNMSNDPCLNPHCLVSSVFVKDLKWRVDILGPKQLIYRLTLGLVMMVHDQVKFTHVAWDVTAGNKT